MILTQFYANINTNLIQVIKGYNKLLEYGTL